MSDNKVFRADLARSVRLFLAFRTEQTAPQDYYAALAQDTILQLSQYAELDGRVVIDVGGGPGFFVRELNHMGARSFCVDADRGEMAALGPPENDSIVASATRMPIASGAVDVCISSNVLEHVRDWSAMLAEMVRVTRPGGIVFVTFTNWLSPYGGMRRHPGITSAVTARWPGISASTARCRRTALATARTRYPWPKRLAGPIRLRESS